MVYEICLKLKFCQCHYLKTLKTCILYFQEHQSVSWRGSCSAASQLTDDVDDASGSSIPDHTDQDDHSRHTRSSGFHTSGSNVDLRSSGPDPETRAARDADELSSIRSLTDMRRQGNHLLG